MELKFSQAEKDIFAPLLETCSDELSNNSCNDYPIQITEENRQAVEDLIDAIGMDQDHCDSMMEQVAEGKVYFQDWMILDYLKKKILMA
jgi:hypothetical protein